MKQLIIAILFWFSIANINAQNVLSIYNMRHLPQVVYANPAFVPLARVNISVPYFGSTYAQIGKSNFVTDVTTVDQGTLRIDTKKFLDGLEDENELYAGLSIEALHVGVTVGKNYFFVSSNDKISSNFIFPKEMAILITEIYDDLGAPNRINIDNVLLGYTHYREFGFGWSRKFNEKITLGARFKYLSGIAAVKTNTTGLVIDGASAGNDLTGLVQINMETSGANNYKESIEEINDFNSFFNSPFIGLTGTNNNGFAMDLGIDYRINPKIKIAMSALDLGGIITWNDNVKNYSTDTVRVDFNTVGWENIFDPNDGENSFRSFLDSIIKNTDPAVESRPFTTTVPSKILGSFTYFLTPKIEATLLGEVAFANNYFQPYLRVAIQGRFKRLLNYMISYSIIDDHVTVENLGIGLVLNLGPVQIHAITDNVFDPFLFKNKFHPSLRFGLNLTIGRDHE